MKLAPPLRSAEPEATTPPDPRQDWLLTLTDWLWPFRWTHLLIVPLLLTLALIGAWQGGYFKNEKARSPTTTTAPVDSTTTTNSMALADPLPSGADFETSAGIISFELMPDEKEVERFVAFARKGVFEGAYFLRSPNGVVVLGNLDSPYSTSTNMSRAPHQKGTLSIPLNEPSRRLTTLMFVCLNDSPPSSLDAQYVVIGRLRPEHFSVVERIARNNRMVVIHKVRLR